MTKYFDWNTFEFELNKVVLNIKRNLRPKEVFPYEKKKFTHNYNKWVNNSRKRFGIHRLFGADNWNPSVREIGVK